MPGHYRGDFALICSLKYLLKGAEFKTIVLVIPNVNVGLAQEVFKQVLFNWLGIFYGNDSCAII
jgi:hypothetical protein